MTGEDWGWDPDTFANGFLTSAPILEPSIDTSNCEPYRGSPIAMKVLLAIVVVVGIVSIAIAAPAYSSQYVAIAVSGTLQSASSVQDDTFAQSGAYLSDASQLKANGASISWPSRLAVVASCSDGYVLSASFSGGDRTYLSSAQVPLGASLKSMKLPDCVTPQMLGHPATIPDQVDGLTVARATSGTNVLGEGVHVKWQSVTGCSPDEHPVYTVTASNALNWSQKPIIATTSQTKMDVQQVWNGSRYAVTVAAQCSPSGRVSDSAKVNFAQTLPAPTAMDVHVAAQWNTFVSMDYTKVSSSPLVTYYSEYNKSGAWHPLVSGLRETSFRFFPAEYRYGYRDTFRVAAMSDDGFKTAYSPSTVVAR